MIQVNEIFGPTIQGEGRNIGMPTMFLRVGGNPETGAPGCNLHCRWCDSAYTWRYSDRFPHNSNIVYDAAKENRLMWATDIFEEIASKAGDTRNLVISGGEPMLFQKDLEPLTKELVLKGWHIEVETAGTIKPYEPFADIIDQFNVSLKLSNSGNPLGLRIQPQAIELLRDWGNCVWKFVVSGIEDFDEIDKLVEDFELSPVYVMPEGVDKTSLLQHTYVEEIIKRGYYLTPRLHIQLWGNERGR